MAEEIITISDVRRAGHCVSGARRWFQAHHLDFRAFLQNGIEVNLFLGTGDQLATDIVNHKRRRTSNG